MPSEKDLENEEAGAIIRRFLKGRDDIPTEDRMRILRLIENMTLGRNAVGYLTESMHGAGSPRPSASRSCAAWTWSTRNGTPASWRGLSRPERAPAPAAR